METFGEFLEVILICFICLKMKELYEELVRRYEYKQLLKAAQKEEKAIQKYQHHQKVKAAQRDLIKSWKDGEI